MADDVREPARPHQRLAVTSRPAGSVEPARPPGTPEQLQTEAVGIGDDAEASGRQPLRFEPARHRGAVVARAAARNRDR